MVYGQCPGVYDGALALDLARTAVEDRPEGDFPQIAHGMALYRHGRFREAREALLRAAELRVPKPEPWELFALAMTESKLGNRAEAHDYYDRGVARMNATYPRFPEYIMLRDEAAELIGIEP
jgi:Flp pilus assembly protein TadD